MMLKGPRIKKCHVLFECPNTKFRFHRGFRIQICLEQDFHICDDLPFVSGEPRDED